MYILTPRLNSHFELAKSSMVLFKKLCRLKIFKLSNFLDKDILLFVHPKGMERSGIPAEKFLWKIPQALRGKLPMVIFKVL